LLLLSLLLSLLLPQDNLLYNGLNRCAVRVLHGE